MVWDSVQNATAIHYYRNTYTFFLNAKTICIDKKSKAKLHKAIQLGMLPKKLSDADKFKLAKKCGFEGVEAYPMRDLDAARRLAETARKAGWVGVRVHHRAGVDTVCSDLDGETLVETSDGLRFKGRFGAIRRTASGSHRGYLVGGHLFETSEETVKGNGSIRSRIARVLHRRNAIEITPPIPSADRFIGREVLVMRGEHRTSYTIRSASTASTTSLGRRSPIARNVAW